MKRWLQWTSASFVLFFLFVGCASGPDEQKLADVAKNYAALVYANYSDVEKQLKELQASIDAFLKNPTKDGLEDCKKKWLTVRATYGQTEVFRFYSGPIDDDKNGREGQINAWPLDEAYIDYVKGNDKAGIINNLKDFPKITKDVLIAQNEKGGEKNISTGFHAIEFLLWGQDQSPTTAGQRPHTDFIVGKGGTAANQERRKTYLKLSMEILLADIQYTMKAWAPDTTDNYRGTFTSGDAKAAIQKIITGMGSLSLGELAGERMTTPYEEKDQEEEHSCFSDNTKADILNNAQGILNVYLGKYGSVSGASLSQLVASLNPDLDKQLTTELNASITAIKAIPDRFDQAILGDDSADGRKKVKAAIEALTTQTQTIAKVAELLGVKINFDLKFAKSE